MVDAHNQIMGVLNITPDSFSDGGQATNFEDFSKKFNDLLNWANIIDLGAESTAPFNSKVESNEELHRYQSTLFPYLRKNSDPETTLSIDTYKIDVFKSVAKEIHHYWPKTKIIFNDVSGKIDDKLFNLWDELDFKFDYVFSHNLAPSRDLTQKHMDYIYPEKNWDFVKICIDYFLLGLEKLKDVPSQIIIDPLFGFSKTREQNQFLLRSLKSFLLQFDYKVPCLIGISRKSFLRVPKDLDINISRNKDEIDMIQSILLYNFMQDNLKRTFLYRVHDPVSVTAAMKAYSLYNQDFKGETL